MRVETRLPLGKLDPGVRATGAALDIRTVAGEANRAEALGYDGIITEETKDDPYIVMALAAQATDRATRRGSSEAGMGAPRVGGDGIGARTAPIPGWRKARATCRCRPQVAVGNEQSGHRPAPERHPNRVRRPVDRGISPNPAPATRWDDDFVSPTRPPGAAAVEKAQLRSFRPLPGKEYVYRLSLD